MTVIGFRQLGRRCNGRSRANEIVRELTFSIAIAMPTRYRLALLTLISALYIAVFSSLLPVGHSREDFVVRLDSQRTLPKVKVTGRRGGGFSFGYLSLNMGRGGSIGFNPFYNLHNQSDLEAKCEGAGHDNPACLLLCEIFPHSRLCWRSFGAITVTGQRETPYNDFTRYEIRNGVIVFTSEQKEDDDEKRKEQKRKELESLCEKELDDMFTAKEDFPFAAAFGLEPSEDNAEMIDEYLDQLIKLTEPIMTTGVKGYNNGKPVDYENGLEAHNAFYIDSSGNLTRGKNLTFGTIPGLVKPNFRDDTQFQQMLDSPNTQSLKIYFHTHPNTKEYYVFPSPNDIARFIVDKRYKFVDKHGLLAIGFMSNNKYRLLLMSVTDNQVLFEMTRSHAISNPKTTLDNIAYIKKYGKILELLFKNSKMLIIELNDNKVKISDYFEFFEDNPLNQKVGDTQVIPQSCLEALKESKQ